MNKVRGSGIGSDLNKLILELSRMTQGDLRLKFGEMTAQEMRTVRAVLNWILRRLKEIENA